MENRLLPCYSLLDFHSSIVMLQWFVDEKVAIGAVKDSCRLIEEEEVEVRPEKLPDATIDDNIDVYLIRKYFTNDALP